jgi:hypothetical protein
VKIESYHYEEPHSWRLRVGHCTNCRCRGHIRLGPDKLTLEALEDIKVG